MSSFRQGEDIGVQLTELDHGPMVGSIDCSSSVTLLERQDTPKTLVAESALDEGCDQLGDMPWVHIILVEAWLTLAFDKGGDADEAKDLDNQLGRL